MELECGAWYEGRFTIIIILSNRMVVMKINYIWTQIVTQNYVLEIYFGTNVNDIKSRNIEKLLWKLYFSVDKNRDFKIFTQDIVCWVNLSMPIRHNFNYVLVLPNDVVNFVSWK